MILHLKQIPLPPHFGLCFSTLEKQPSVGDVLWVPAVPSSLITQGPGASGPRAVSSLHLQTTVCWIVAFFLLVSAPWWVRGCSRSLCRLPSGELMPADVWVELGPGPLVGRMVSRCLSCPEVTVGSGSLSATCLLTGRAVFLPG